MNLERTSKPTLLPIVIGFLIGCGTPQIRSLATPYVPHGPGAEFATVEEAAVDALAYAHDQAVETRTLELLRGGAIVRTERGFTYDEIAVASTQRPNYIEYALRGHHVARFHAYPRTDRPRDDYRNEKPSRKDRRSVNEVDPLHRPVYVLTPKLLVKAYFGSELPVETVANLRELSPAPYLAAAGAPGSP